MSSPSVVWPRAYLLQLYAAAVEHGMIYAEPITEQDAASLKASLYRLRRKRDSNAQWILPEYHLVSVAPWEPVADFHKSQPEWPSELLGRLPLIYSRLASGAALPCIRPATPAEAPSSIPLPQHPDEPEAQAILQEPSLAFQPDPATGSPSLELTPSQISSYVEQLKAKAKQ